MIGFDVKFEGFESMKAFLSPETLRRIMDDTQNWMAGEAKHLFEETTETWSRKPEFQVVRVKDKDHTTLTIGTDSDVYRFLDKGTRKNYPIPKPGNTTAKTLRFLSGYMAKTKPGILRSYAGGSFGSWQYRKSVTHPGIQARRFSERVIQALEKPAAKVYFHYLELAWKKAIRSKR